jgi:hypothetical protein
MDICMGNRKWQWIPCWLLRAQKSIARNRFRQAGNRFLGSLTGLQIRALIIASFSPLCHMFPMFSSKLFVRTFFDQLPKIVSVWFLFSKSVPSTPSQFLKTGFLLISQGTIKTTPQ